MASTEIIRVVVIDISKHNNHRIQTALSAVIDIDLIAIFDDYYAFDSTVQQCVELKPDVILIDASTHLFEYFKIFHQTLPASPVICMTVSSSNDLLKDGMTLGIRFFLPKPVENDQLVDTIKQVYQQYMSLRDGTYKFPDDE